MIDYLLCFRKMVTERGLSFKVKIIESLSDSTKFHSDWRVYKSILYHILYNAIKFCIAKGKIGLEVTYEALDESTQA